MRRLGLWIAMPAAFFLLDGPVDVESADTKYGVVNIQRVLRASKGGRRVRAFLAREKKKLESDIRKKRDALTKMAREAQGLQLAIDQKSAVWRPEEKERKTFELRSQRRRLAREQDNLKRLLRESQRDLQERQRIGVTKVLKEVRSVVQEIGKEGDWDAIVDSTSGGVLFVSPRVDLTEKVIQRYDQKKK